MFQAPTWVYDGSGCLNPLGPVTVESLGAEVDAFADAEQAGPTPPELSAKQKAAWDAFVALDARGLRTALADGLTELAGRARRLEGPAPGSTLHVLDKARSVARRLDEASHLLRHLEHDWPPGVRPSLLVLPRQSCALPRLLLLYLEVDRGEEFPFEVEVLFADEVIALVGEHSGLFARLEWEQINTPEFDPATVAHPYW